MLLIAAAFLLPLGSASPVRRAPSVIHAGLTRKANTQTSSPRAEAAYVAAKHGGGALESRRVDNPGAENALFLYTTEVGVGSGGDTYHLTFDTGSAITWVGAPFGPYHTTSTSVPTGFNFSNTYGSGATATGPLINDTLTLAPGVPVKQMPIGNTTYPTGTQTDHYYEDGILGVAPSIATTNKVVGHPEKELVTPVQAAFQQGMIPEPTFGVYFAPVNETEDTLPDDIPPAARNGVISYGGYATELTTGDMFWSPRTKVNGTSARGWGLDLLEFKVGGQTVSNGTIAGIVDTGTTLIYMPTDYWQKYFDAIPDAGIDPTGLIKFPNASLPHVPDIEFVFEGGSIVINKYAQLVPLWAYDNFGYLGGDHGDTLYSYVWDWGKQSGQGFDFIIGQKILERWYSAYDLAQDRIGFASTKYTYPTTFPEKL